MLRALLAGLFAFLELLAYALLSHDGPNHEGAW
jgi:hypothetical protein